VYFFVVIAIWLIFGGLALNLYGLLSDKSVYGRLGVRGGTCPFYSADACSAVSSADYARPGCAANATASWAANNGTYPYPPNADRTYTTSTDPNDPNAHGAFHLWYVQVVIGAVGAFFGIIIVIVSPGWIMMAFSEKKLLKPMLVLKMAILGRFAFNLATAAFLSLVVLSVITLTVHLLDEQNARTLYYFDAVGLRNVHGGGAAGGELWTDCFVLGTPVDRTGHFNDWWAGRESKVLRVLAFV
jgi:hypothetical protein